MTEKPGYKSTMQVPRIKKVAINMGMREAKDNPKALESAISDSQIITGQKSVLIRVRELAANSKIGENTALEYKIILRKTSMYEFVNKLVPIALPRVRDFRGVLAKTFDGGGNYSLGIREQLIFPEIEHDKTDKVRGMDIISVTNANIDEETGELLRFPGVSFVQ